MRRLLVIVLSCALSACAVGAAAAAPASAAAPADKDVQMAKDGALAPAAVSSLLSVSTDDALDLPPAWPAAFPDQVQEPDFADLWKVSLVEGQQIIVNMKTVEADDDLDLCLWAPETTDFSWPSLDSLVHSASWSGPESFKYIVPEGAGGTYYIEVWWDTLSSLVTGSYAMWVSVQSPSTTAVRITPPAVPWRLRSHRDYTWVGTLKPLHYAGDRTVRVVLQRYSAGAWRAYGSYRTENRNYYNGTTRYTRFKISGSFYGGNVTTRFRIRAIHLRDALHPRKASAWRYFTVAP